MGESPQKLISIVDDDLSMLELYQTILSGKYRLFTTPSPREFLDHLETVSPDLLIIDIMMPVLNGLEVLENLKQQYDLPVLCISGSDSSILQGEAKLLANVFITKPFKPKDLLERIEENLVCDL